MSSAELRWPLVEVIYFIDMCHWFRIYNELDLRDGIRLRFVDFEDFALPTPKSSIY